MYTRNLKNIMTVLLYTFKSFYITILIGDTEDLKCYWNATIDVIGM